MHQQAEHAGTPSDDQVSIPCPCDDASNEPEEETKPFAADYCEDHGGGNKYARTDHPVKNDRPDRRVFRSDTNHLTLARPTYDVET